MRDSVIFRTDPDLIAAAIRHCLKRYFGKSSPSFEELQSAYTEIIKAFPAIPGLERLYQRACKFSFKAAPVPIFYRDILALTFDATKSEEIFSAQVAETKDTLLHLAVSSMSKPIESVEMVLVMWLLRHGANIGAENKSGLAPAAYMMESGKLLEQFYRKWLIEHPPVWEKVSLVLSQLAQHWEDYNTKLTRREVDNSEGEIMAQRRVQRRTDLNKLRGLMERVLSNHFIVWDLPIEVRRLEANAPRGRRRISELYDKTMPLIKELEGIFVENADHTEGPYTKKQFVLETNVSLTSKSREQRGRSGLVKLLDSSIPKFIARPQTQAERNLPATEAALQDLLHRKMIADAMRSAEMRDTARDTFYNESETPWGRVWARLQAMTAWLYKYDRLLTARENRSPIYKWIMREDLSRLAARRREWRAYKTCLDSIFGINVFDYIKASDDEINVWYAILPRKNPVYEGSAGESDEKARDERAHREMEKELRKRTMEGYLKFSELVILIKAGRLAGRGPTGLSDLHDNMYRQWAYVRVWVESWLKEQLTDSDNLAALFSKAYKELRYYLLAPPAIATALSPFSPEPFGLSAPPPLLTGAMPTRGMSALLGMDIPAAPTPVRGASSLPKEGLNPPGGVGSLPKEGLNPPSGVGSLPKEGLITLEGGDSLPHPTGVSILARGDSDSSGDTSSAPSAGTGASAGSGMAPQARGSFGGSGSLFKKADSKASPRSLVEVAVTAAIGLDCELGGRHDRGKSS